MILRHAVDHLLLVSNQKFDLQDKDVACLVGTLLQYVGARLG
jgi:hypothetical protein